MDSLTRANSRSPSASASPSSEAPDQTTTGVSASAAATMTGRAASSGPLIAIFATPLCAASASAVVPGP